MYIVGMGKKAFVRFEESGDVTIVSTPNKATPYKLIGDAMVAAVRINEDFEAHVAKVIYLSFQ